MIIQSQNDNEYYRLVPFEIDFSSNYQDFSIATTTTITNISNEYIDYLIINDQDQLYQIDANISLQFLNKYSGDIEITHYEFMIYPEFDNDGNILPPTHIVKNQIFSIDTSFNYASSSINLLEHLDNNKNKINFLIKSTSLENLQQLRVDCFNCTIKCIG